MWGSMKAILFAQRATEEENKRVDEKLAAMRRMRMQSAKTSAGRIQSLEDDLGRVALLARALAEVCMRKGLLTEAELHAIIDEVDLADGVSDGKLAPDVVLPGESKQAPPPYAVPPQAKIVRRKRDER